MGARAEVYTTSAGRMVTIASHEVSDRSLIDVKDALEGVMIRVGGVGDVLTAPNTISEMPRALEMLAYELFTCAEKLRGAIGSLDAMMEDGDEAGQPATPDRGGAAL